LFDLQIETSEVFYPLLEPARYKGAYGGRGSGKSHFFAELGIEDALRWPGDAGEGLRLLSFREVQKSLKQSAKFLLESKLHKFGLGEQDGFRVYTDRISTPGDGVIAFTGMQDHTADSVKSYEGFHRAWGEEAQSITAHSMSLLRPTIRWEDTHRGLESELWFGWNPRSKFDAVDKLLRGDSPPQSSIVVEANWSDNHRFPKVLEAERQYCLTSDPDSYDHIWEGGYGAVVAGAYYVALLNDAKRGGRITSVDLSHDLPIHTAWDLGIGDSMAIWVFQAGPEGMRLIDYLEDHGMTLGHYVTELETRGYRGGYDYVPHDAKVRSLDTGRSRLETLVSLGRKPVLLPASSLDDGINGVRQLMPRMWFDGTRCEYGLEALRNYRTEYDEGAQIFKNKPLHNWASHCADAMRYAAQGYRDLAIKKVQEIAKPKPGQIMLAGPPQPEETGRRSGI
jgi:phage terminase large subunit